jgi:hypothetical protein
VTPAFKPTVAIVKAGREPNAVEPLPTLSIGQLLESTSPPALIKDVLTEGGTSLVYGASGLGKTQLVLYTAGHLSTGQASVFGRKIRRKVGCIYVAAEGRGGLKARAEALAQHTGIRLTEGAFEIVATAVDLFAPHADTPRLVATVKAAALRMGCEVGLIVIDTLARSMGDGDENSTRDMNQFVRNVDRVREDTGAHVCIVHHVGKDADRGPRGSYALFANVDTVIELRKDSGSKITTATITKQRDGEDGVTLTAFKLRRVILGHDEDGDEISSAVLDPIDPNEAPTRKPGKKRMNPAEVITLRELTNALASEGKPVPSDPNIPSSAKVVPVSAWRERTYQAGVADGTQDAKRKAFARAKDALVAAGLAGVWGEWAWLV